MNFFYAISIYVIPFVVGLAIQIVYDYIKALITKKESKPKDYGLTKLIGIIIEAIVFGHLAIYGLALGLKSFSNNLSPDFFNYIKVVFFVSLGIIAIRTAYIIWKKVSSKDWQKEKPQNVRKDVLVLVLLMGIVALSQTIWRWNSGLNTTLDWDVYLHQTITNQIVKGNFAYKTSELTDSVRLDAYPTTFHILISLPFYFFKPDLLAFWWYAGFLHLAMVTIISYYIGYSISKNRWIGLINAILGGLTFESAVAYTTYFLVPQNFTAVMFAGLLAKYFMDYKDEDYLVHLKMIVYVVYLLICHYVIGTFGVLLLLLAVFVYKLMTSVKAKWVTTALLGLSFASIFIAPLVFQNLNLININPGESEYYVFTLAQKFDFFTLFYGYLFVFFIPMGIIYLYRTRNVVKLLAIMMFFGMTALLISPIPYSLKFLAVIRFMVTAIMSYGVWSVLRYVGRPIKILLIIIFTMAVSAILIINVQEYKATPRYKDSYSHISFKEQEAAEYIKNRYSGTNVMLISDPATMFLFEGITGINSPGGAYAEFNTRQILYEIYFNRDSELMNKRVGKISDGLATVQKPDKYVLVLSGRYEDWAQSEPEKRDNFFYNVWAPKDLNMENLDFVNFLTQTKGFEKVFDNSGVVVFEINPL